MDGANLLGAVDADGKSLEMAYDDLNSLTALVDRRGYTTTFTYAGELPPPAPTPWSTLPPIPTPPPQTCLSRPDCSSGWSYRWTIHPARPPSTSTDSFGQVRVVTDTENHTTQYSYDNLGRLATLTDALGRDTRYEYDDAGRLLRLTRNYDPVRPQNDGDLYNIVTGYGYDQVGNLTVVTDTLGNETQYLYNENNRLVKVTDALEHSTSYDYDPNGNLTSKTDAANVVTFYEYDDLNRLVAVVENYRPGVNPDFETNVRTEYSFDPAGNLTAFSRRPGGVGEPPGCDRVCLRRPQPAGEREHPLSYTTRYDYDPEGNRTVMTDTLSAVTHYGYDPLSRLTLIDYPSPDADVTFEYNFAGWRTSMTDALGDTTWDYDDLGQVETVTDPFNQVVGYDYDEVGNRRGLTYPDTKSVGYVYDDLDRLETVTDWAQGVTQYDYDPLGRLEETLLPGGISSAYSYDPLGQVKSIDHSAPGSSLLAAYDYAYDQVGNRSAVTETLTQPLADLIFADGFDFRGLPRLVGDEDHQLSRPGGDHGGCHVRDLRREGCAGQRAGGVRLR